MTIRARLLLLTIGLIIPLVLFGFYNLWSAWHASREKLNESIEQQANLAATAFEQWLGAQRQTLVTISTLSQDSNSATLKDFLNSIVKTRPHWLDVQIVSPTGEILLSQTVRDKPLPLVSIETLRQEVNQKKRLVIFTEQITDENLRLLSMAMPIENGNFVVARIDGTYVSNVFKQLDLPEEHVIAVFDPNNRLLYRNRVSPEQMSQDVSKALLLSALKNSRSATVEIESPYDKIKRVYGLAKVETANCIIAVGVPSSELYQFARNQYWLQFWFGLVITILAVMLALFIAQGIVEPLRVLTIATRLFGAGNLTIRSPIIGHGSLRQLGINFNQMAEHIADREEKLKALDRLKSDFVSNVSHELRTPLTTIKALTRVLRNQKLNASQKEEYLQTIAIECDRQIDFVQNLLDLSRIESGAYKVSFKPIEIYPLLVKTIETHKRAALAKGINLTLDHTVSSFPEVETDSATLQRIVISLIENAIKYTQQNGTIRVKVKELAEKIAITISDNGCGINSDDLPQIFEKYFRGRPFIPPVDLSQDENDSDKFPSVNETSGIGLGLYLVKSLVDQLKGEIMVESPFEENFRGTRFTILIPIKINTLESVQISFQK
ncbi:MAG: HAMP domain-containing protein [Pyrinomonadaceae bacterium]|nr:HAMP domain-containing protein [Pyrinomonadaceae bacterium]